MKFEKKWQVTFSNRAAKQFKKLPKKEQENVTALVADLSLRGAMLSEWPNFSKLGQNNYHCHLSYKWVACWQIEDDMLKIIEIYYVGSRENAPY